MNADAQHVQPLTISQIERLGERLRREVTEKDLALLRQLRESYRPKLDDVVDVVRRTVEARADVTHAMSLSTRPAKTTASIIAKLLRERTNLARMQDIAGCRVVVALPEHQAWICRMLAEQNPTWRVVDRRGRPIHGYRAIHLVTARPHPVEIQVRTWGQQVWAMVSEYLDRRFGGIKYGEGPERVLDSLSKWSDRIAQAEGRGEVTVELVSDRDAFFELLRDMLDET